MELKIVLLLISFLIGAQAKEDELFTSMFYTKTCPRLENIVHDVMKSVSREDPHIPAAMLRLLFHDCRVGGCDGSILLDAKDSEISSSLNYGIRNRDVINKIKSAVEEMCPRQVSCADLIALAAREAVAMSGGPTIDIQLGRRDSSVGYSRFDADQNLPLVREPAFVGVNNVRDFGVSPEEGVALIGAHTLGDTHCISLQYRLSIDSFVPGNETLFVNTLKRICNSSDSTNAIPMDPTPRVFDNKFFINTMNGYGVNLVDSSLREMIQTRKYLEKFAEDEAAFFRAFSSGFIKMSSYNVLTGKLGVIRKECNKAEAAA